MKVYVVTFHWEYEDGNPVGVFSTLDAAYNCAAEAEAGENRNYATVHEFDLDATDAEWGKDVTPPSTEIVARRDDGSVLVRQKDAAERWKA